MVLLLRRMENEHHNTSLRNPCGMNNTGPECGLVCELEKVTERWGETLCLLRCSCCSVAGSVTLERESIARNERGMKREGLDEDGLTCTGMQAKWNS